MKQLNCKHIFLLCFFLSVVSNSYASGLNGSYTIDKSKAPSSTNYTSFNDADSDLTYGSRANGAITNGPGISAAVNFNIADGIYQEQLKIGNISGVSAKNTITFQGHTNDSTKVVLMDSSVGTSGAPGASYTLYLDSTKYIHFSEITISKAYGGIYDVALLIDYSSHNSFDKCLFMGPASSAPETYGLVYSGNDNSEYNSFTNNYMKNGSAYYTIQWFATASEKGNVVSGNYIDTSYFGVLMQYQDSMTITGNRMTIINGSGIYIYNVGMTAFAGNINIVANNAVLIKGPGIFGNLTVYNTENTNIVYNNIDVDNESAGIYFGSTIGTIKAKKVNVYNNNFIDLNIGITACAIFADNYYFTNENYNNLYTDGQALVHYNATNYKDLKAWKASGFGFAKNDLSINPFYLPALKLTGKSPLLDGKGTPVSYAKTDIDGVSRNASNPDIGAYEFTPALIDPQITAIPRPSSGMCAGTKDVYVTLTNGGSSTLTSVTIEWEVNGTAQTAYTWSGGLIEGDSTSVNIGTYSISNGVRYKIKSFPGSANGSSITSSSTNTDSSIVMAGLPGGTYTIDPAGSGSTNYLSFREAVRDLNQKGLCGAVVFNVADGVYNESVNIDPIPGSSSANTATFQSASLDASRVELDSSSTGIGSHVLKLNGARYVIFRYMTIADSLPLAFDNSFVVELANNASHDIFENNNLYAPVYNSGKYNAVIGNTRNGLEEFNTLRYNHISGGDISVIFAGIGIHSPEYGNIIYGNTIDSGSYGAIDVALQDSINISQNKVFLTNATGIGIDLFLVEGNGGGRDRSWVTNNFIATSIVSGYALSGVSCDMLNVYNNSAISLADTLAFHSTVFFIVSDTGVNLMNNIMINNAGGSAYYVYFGLGLSDYNDIYSSGPTPGVWDNTRCASLKDWQKASGRDAHSIEKDPAFVSDSTGDLHLTNASAAIGKGIFLSAVSTDIDGDKRPAKNPDMGADQFVMDSNDVGVSLLINPKNNDCGNTNTVVAVIVKNFGLKDQSTLNVHVAVQNSKGTVTAIKAISKTINGYISGGSNTDTEYVSFSPTLNTLPGGTYTIKAYTDLASDSNHLNDTAKMIITITPQPIAGFSVKNICHGNSFSITDTSKNGVTYQYYLINNLGVKVDSSTNKNALTLTSSIAGNYRIWQKVQSTGVCSDTISVAVRIDTVNAAFTHSLPAKDGSVNFKAMDTTLNTYSWNFGDASSSGSGYATSHTYASTGMYYVVLKVASTLGCMDSTIDSFAILITGIENISNSNHVSVYPNPFREKATIEYILNKPSQVKIDISDIFGREVATLVNTYTNAGEYTFTFNASRYNMLTAGVYIIKINIGDHVTTQRITLLK